MSTTSTMPRVFDALTAALADRAGLTGVQVLSAPIGLKDYARESIVLIGAQPSTDGAAVEGNITRFEDYTIDGAVWVAQPGSNEADFKAIRDRAFDLLGEIEEYLRTDAGMQLSDALTPDQVMFCEMTRKGFSQGIHPDIGRQIQIDFGIRIQARLQL